MLWGSLNCNVVVRCLWILAGCQLTFMLFSRLFIWCGYAIFFFTLSRQEICSVLVTVELDWLILCVSALIGRRNKNSPRCRHIIVCWFTELQPSLVWSTTLMILGNVLLLTDRQTLDCKCCYWCIICHYSATVTVINISLPTVGVIVMSLMLWESAMSSFHSSVMYDWADYAYWC